MTDNALGPLKFIMANTGALKPRRPHWNFFSPACEWQQHVTTCGKDLHRHARPRVERGLGNSLRCWFSMPAVPWLSSYMIIVLLGSIVLLVPESPAQIFTIASWFHLHGRERGGALGPLLDWNYGDHTANCGIGECLRANDRMAWGKDTVIHS